MTNYNELIKKYGGTIIGDVRTLIPTISEEEKQVKASTERFKPTFAAGAEETQLSSVLKLIGNMPSSTWNFAKRIVSALNPLTTIKTISKIPGEFKALREEAGGTLEALKLTAKEVPKTTYKGLVPKFIQDIAKGDLEEANRSIVNDPVGQIAPVLLVTKYAFDKAGKGAAFDKAISTMAKPVTVPAAYIGGKIAGGVRGLAERVAGTTTGAGKEAIKEAYKGGEEFTKAMRKETTPENVVDSAIKALEKVKETRRAKYVAELSKLKESKKTLDISPIRKELNVQLEKFNVKRDLKGELDFSQATIGKIEAITDVKGVVNTLEGWTDNTAFGLDILKKRLGDFYTESGEARAFVNAMKSSVNQTIVNQMPEYTKLTLPYQETSNFIAELKSLSIGGKATPDTIFKKLTSTLKQNNEIRLNLLQELQRQGNVNLTSQIAGVQLSTWASRSGLVRLGTSGGVVGVVTGLFSPQTLFALVSTSPRVVGEFVRALGLSQAKTASFLETLKSVRSLFEKVGALKSQDIK